MPFDWQQFHAAECPKTSVVDPRRRLRISLAGFVVLLLLVFGRTVQLELTQGAGFRAEALRPVEKEMILPASRGRILARDGTVLAYDRTIEAVAVHYRSLQDPPDGHWLRTTARARLSRGDRQNTQKLAAEMAKVLVERTDLMGRLAKLCGLSTQQLAARTRRIQVRVERIAASANRRRRSETAETAGADESWAVHIRRLLLEDPPAPRITVAEELAYHVVANDVPTAVVGEINAHLNRYPGMKIVELARRTYPYGTLAAHVLGHLGPVDEKDLVEQPRVPQQAGTICLPDGLVGRMGVERQHEAVLRGRPGVAVEQTDHRGRVVASYCPREPLAGRDVVLALDPALQRTAEELLDSARQRRVIIPGATRPAGGAIVVMDVHDGAIRAAASTPTFDPNLFVGGESEELAVLLADKTYPLIDRVSRMAIPPGSTFKVLTAAALLQSAVVGPQESFLCRGYLHRPDQQRCEIYVRQGVGHGEVALADALAVSCNVYFFHFAGQMGPRPLVQWADRFGFGRLTGVDLPGEAAGTLPSPENIRQLEGHAWRTVDTQSMAIGQGSLQATPLQVLRMIAAVATGGHLLTPRVEKRGQNYYSGEIDRFDPAFLKVLPAIREGLQRAVSDPQGTAHATVYLPTISVAGKTGTAETGADGVSHAWFAGYVPTEAPKLAFVIVLEHAGDAAVTAGPLAKRLVLRMEQLGML
jgi:penicillin-binding protein 2